MTADEHAIYKTLYDGIVRTLRPPDLMIYLRASVRTVRRRIKHRQAAGPTGCRLGPERPPRR